MNKDWQKMLASFGASVDSEGGVSFADAAGVTNTQYAEQAPSDSPLLVDLSHLAVVDITGTDAQTFFQAQVCNDIAALSDSDIQINGYCTPKGRLLALFTVFKQEDGVRLVLPADIVQPLTKRLQMFVMRAQVSIHVRDDLICSGLVFNSSSEADTVELLADVPTLPAAELQIAKNPRLQVMRWHDAPLAISTETDNQIVQQRFLCIAEPDVMSTLWQSKGFVFRSGSYWRWGDINAGVPNVFASSTEQFIPQMLNMQLINALSFKKGCYPGQEIVARMQYLGKLKKHMRHLRVPGASVAPEPGEVLTTNASNNAGQVVDAVVDEAGLNLLAVVNIDTQATELKLGDHTFADAPIPYSLMPEDTQAS